MKVRFYATLMILLGALVINAQDAHFSQFYASPLTLNPALTGNFNGFYRISGIYRNQEPGLAQSNPVFSTPSIAADVSLLKDKIKNGALGVGLVFLNDQQNGKTFNSNQFMLSVAYNMTFGAVKRFQLGAGLQGGIASTKADFSKLQFDDGFTVGQNNTLNYTQSTEALNTKAATKGLFNAGIFSKYEFATGMRVYVGYSFNNASHYKENYILNSIQQFNIPFRHTLHGGFEFEVNDRIVLIPGVMYQNEASANETNFGLNVGIHVVRSPDPMKVATLFVGLWNRLNTKNYTLIPELGFDYKGFRAGIAYDAPLTQQRTDGNVIGGPYAQAFELTLSYIGNIIPKKEDNYLFNPRY
jgi:type IX secretion system PorP/SprF family membrane protein